MRITGITIIVLISLMFFLTDILGWAFESPQFWYRPYILWVVVIALSAIMHKAAQHQQ